jgi:hypothetical protein
MRSWLAATLTMGMAVAVAVSGCVRSVEAAPTPQATASDFFAWALGTRWTYEVQLLGATETREVKLVKKTPEGFLEDSTGAQFLFDAFGVRDQKRYLLRNPVASGTTWTNVVSVSSVESYEILATGQPCATRAGSWSDCVVVESKNRIEPGKTLINEYTLAPGVGIVRLATTLDAGKGRLPQARLELVAFAKP